MKVTLRRVNEGIIATADEPCKEGEWGYNLNTNKISPPDDLDGYWFDLNAVLASTFGVGMELWLDHESSFMPFDHYYKKTQNLMVGKDYSYTIESDKLIITL